MALIFAEQFDAGPNGGTQRGVAGFNAYSTTDPTYTNSPVVTGGFAGRFAVGATSANCFAQVSSTALGTRALLYARTYIYLTANPAASIFVMATNLAGATRANVRINTDGTVTIRNGTTAVWTSTTPLTLNAWNRLAWRLDATNQQQQIRLYVGANHHGATADQDSGNQTFTTGSVDTFQVGITGATTNTTVVMDSFKLDDAAWVGPEVAQPAQQPPVSAFTATPTSGAVPLTVQFTDTSTGDPTSWSWTFGDGGGSTSTSQVGLLGDSLTFQGGSTAPKDALVAAGYTSANVRVNGVTGRTIPDGAVTPTVTTDITTWRSEGFDPAKWVFALGANNMGSTDAQWTTWIQERIEQIAAGPRSAYTIYWVGLALRRDPAPTDPNRTEAIVDRFQAVLNSPAVTGHSPKVTFVPLDWNAHIHNGRDETGLWTSDTDGRHMTTAGYAIRNSFVANAVPPGATSGGSTQQNPSHTYQTAGTYTATLTASNAAGADATPATATITATATAPPPPAAGVVNGRMPVGDQLVTFRFRTA